MFDINAKIVKLLPGMDLLMEAFREAEMGIDVLGREFGVRCPAGCARCCMTESGNIETSVFELLPMAVHLWQTGRAEYYFGRAKSRGDSGMCALLNDGPGLSGYSCDVYRWRPVICRLFGFSAVRDKYGNAVLSSCGALFRDRADLKDSVNAALKNGLVIPVNMTSAMKARGISPSLGERTYGINEAMIRAIEHVGYRLDMISAINDHENERPPRFPSGRKSA